MTPHDFWQDLAAGDDIPPPPYTDRFPARLADGRVLWLPIRPLAGTDTAIASLILTQASFRVEAALADAVAGALAESAPEIVVGLPTLGLPLARAVAERLGHDRYIAAGTSRKFWYDETLSVPLSSITSPEAVKRLYLDPRMLPLLEGRRVALIDDAISSGRSICAGLKLLQAVGVAPVAIGAAMLQTTRWETAVETAQPGAAARVRGAFRSPLLHAGQGGWWPE